VQQQREHGVLIGLRQRAYHLQQQLDGTLFFVVLIRYRGDIANDIESEVAFCEGSSARRE
jgi:hypothetical protein